MHTKLQVKLSARSRRGKKMMDRGLPSLVKSTGSRYNMGERKRAGQGGSTVEVHIPDLFDLQKIAGSGQCFRAAAFPDGTYRFITGEHVLYIRQVAEQDYSVSCPPEAWETIWTPYFDLERDYRSVSDSIPPDDTFLRCAAGEGAGIRILRQDPWEMLLTFIISQRKSIPAIRSVVEQLSERYGSRLQTPREAICAFPAAQQLRTALTGDYAACGAGYRAPYLLDAVERVLSGRLDLREIDALPDSGLLAALQEVRGVGAKVASCVALFAYGRTACAPVDTWIRKIIRREYGGRDPFARYGAGAGIMQQYFFYYAQNHKAQAW